MENLEDTLAESHLARYREQGNSYSGTEYTHAELAEQAIRGLRGRGYGVRENGLHVMIISAP